MISRNPSNSDLWPALSWADLNKVIDKSDVVINLAGRSVNCRYNAANRKVIIDSRTTTTRAIGEAIQRIHPERPSSNRRPNASLCTTEQNDIFKIPDFPTTHRNAARTFVNPHKKVS